jgi:hypothetical protein
VQALGSPDRAVQRGHELMRRGAHDEAVDAAPPQLRLVGRDVVVDRRVGLGVVEVTVARPSALARFSLPKPPAPCHAASLHPVGAGFAARAAGWRSPSDGTDPTDRCRYALDITISLWTCFKLQPCVMSSSARGSRAAPGDSASAAKAEVARRVHQTLAEVVMPEAVHDHAGRERILGMRDPIREREHAAALRTFCHHRSQLTACCHPGKGTRRDVLSFILGIAATLHLDHRRFRLGNDRIDLFGLGNALEGFFIFRLLRDFVNRLQLPRASLV